MPGNPNFIPHASKRWFIFVFCGCLIVGLTWGRPLAGHDGKSASVGFNSTIVEEISERRKPITRNRIAHAKGWQPVFALHRVIDSSWSKRLPNDLRHVAGDSRQKSLAGSIGNYRCLVGPDRAPHNARGCPRKTLQSTGRPVEMWL